MNCPKCDALSNKDGKDCNGEQRFKCTACGKRFTLPRNKLLGAMTLPESKALMCLSLLIEGNSIRSVERITGVHRDMVMRLLETVGKKCLWVQETFVKGIKVADIQADEIWAFVGMRQKTANSNDIGKYARVGSVYTFTAVESNSKLITAWHLGKRTEQDALIFLEKVYNAIDDVTGSFQMSTDAFRGYDHMANEVLGTKADYEQIVTLCKATDPDEVRHSGGECIGVKKRTIYGNSLKEKIATSHVERRTLTMRVSTWRFKRLTNGFSKKFENLNYMLAVFFVYYNFCRGHNLLNGVTPAMAANISKSFWTLRDILNVTPQN